MKRLARDLRWNATEAERRLWKHLRNRRLAGYKFRRQLIIEPYIVDFCCIEAHLVIEVDGGQHNAMRKSDQERTNYLEGLGYRVLRFWNNEVLGETDAVLEAIRRELARTPHPNPSP